MLFYLLAAAAQPPLVAPDCAIDRAVYALDGAPEFTAGFDSQERRKRFASDLVLWLKTPKRTYYFSFGSPNGYGGTYLAPELDPSVSARLSDDEEPDAAAKVDGGVEPMSIAFDAFAANLSALGAPPQSSDPAPALLFARGLGPALWYNPVGLSGGDEKAEAESMPIALFRSTGCEGR